MGRFHKFTCFKAPQRLWVIYFSLCTLQQQEVITTASLPSYFSPKCHFLKVSSSAFSKIHLVEMQFIQALIGVVEAKCFSSNWWLMEDESWAVVGVVLCNTMQISLNAVNSFFFCVCVWGGVFCFGFGLVWFFVFVFLLREGNLYLTVNWWLWPGGSAWGSGLEGTALSCPSPSSAAAPLSFLALIPLVLGSTNWQRLSFRLS